MCLSHLLHKQIASSLNVKSRFYLIPKRCLQASSGKRSKNVGVFWSICYYSALTIGFVTIVDDRLVSCTGVSGSSMQPTINPRSASWKDWVLLNRRVTKDFSMIERGDIVTYKTIRNPAEVNIKRVVALEGDTVKTLGYRNRVVQIPPGHCWVEGDNHSCSDDSNKRGPIPLGLITGRATAIIFPFQRWQTLEKKFPHSRVTLNPDSDTSQIKDYPAVDAPPMFNLYRRRS